MSNCQLEPWSDTIENHLEIYSGPPNGIISLRKLGATKLFSAKRSGRKKGKKNIISKTESAHVSVAKNTSVNQNRTVRVELQQNVTQLKFRKEDEENQFVEGEEWVKRPQRISSSKRIPSPLLVSSHQQSEKNLQSRFSSKKQIYYNLTQMGSPQSLFKEKLLGRRKSQKGFDPGVTGISTKSQSNQPGVNRELSIQRKIYMMKAGIIGRNEMVKNKQKQTLVKKVNTKGQQRQKFRNIIGQICHGRSIPIKNPYN